MTDRTITRHTQDLPEPPRGSLAVIFRVRRGWLTASLVERTWKGAYRTDTGVCDLVCAPLDGYAGGTMTPYEVVACLEQLADVVRKRYLHE